MIFHQPPLKLLQGTCTGEFWHLCNSHAAHRAKWFASLSRFFTVDSFKSILSLLAKSPPGSRLRRQYAKCTCNNIRCGRMDLIYFLDAGFRNLLVEGYAAFLKHPASFHNNIIASGQENIYILPYLHA